MEILGKAKAECHDECRDELREGGTIPVGGVYGLQRARSFVWTGSDASLCNPVSVDWPDFGIGPSGALRRRGQ
jgi:hypothetical protein